MPVAALALPKLGTSRPFGNLAAGEIEALTFRMGLQNKFEPMKSPQPSELSPHRIPGRWGGPILAFVAAFLLLNASRHLLSSYSYWGDEMFSVVESLAPTKEFIHNWILMDVHPPLYQVLLRGWMALFGSGELATRFLSFLFVVLAVLCMAMLTARRPFFFRLVAVVFLGSSPALAFYGQETRSYGMVLALSTLVTLLAMDLREKAGRASRKERWIFALFALLLSLTHYFGLVWVGLLTLLQLLKPTHPAERLQGLILLPFLFLWPVIHMLFGELNAKTGGHFWIKISVPVISSVNNAIAGLLPGLEISRQPQLLLRWPLVFLLLLVLYWPWSAWRQGGNQLSPSARLLLRQSLELGTMILIFIALMAVIDLHTPITTARNFIVLLPPLALTLAGVSQALLERLSDWRRLLLFAALALGLVLQLNSGAHAVARKAYPQSNWKGLAAAIGEAELCKAGCFADFTNTYWTYYFRQTNLKSLPADGSEISRPLVLFNPQNPAAKQSAPNHVCFQARQTALSPVVLIPPRMVDRQALSAKGVYPCGAASPTS